MSEVHRRVVITGANRGLGLELARQCAARGDRVWGGCRDPEGAKGLRGIEGASVLALDVADPASIGALGRALARETDGVDLLLNNAGVNGTAFAVAEDGRGVLGLPPEVFTAQVDVNARGPMLVARALLPLLRAAPAAVIVNVTSQLGSLALGNQTLRDVGYSASKAALNMVTRALAGTLGPEGMITIAMHPGWVRTDMGGEHAPLSPHAAAEAMLETIDRLRPRDNGTFLRWDGGLHPW